MAGATQSLWDAFIADQFRLRETHYASLFPGAEVLMIEGRGGAGGRFATVGTVTAVVGTDETGARTARIVTIEIASATRGRGIGGKVIAGLAASARFVGIARLELAVSASNIRAIRLYERLGFVARRSDGEPHGHRELWLDLMSG